jgi:hypothetical protein
MKTDEIGQVVELQVGDWFMLETMEDDELIEVECSIVAVAEHQYTGVSLAIAEPKDGLCNPELGRCFVFEEYAGERGFWLLGARMCRMRLGSCPLPVMTVADPDE